MIFVFLFIQVILGEYEWQTFDEVMTNITALGSGLLALGQNPRQNICVFAETRAEWMLVAQACFKYNFPGRISLQNIGRAPTEHLDFCIPHVPSEIELLLCI